MIPNHRGPGLWRSKETYTKDIKNRPPLLNLKSNVPIVKSFYYLFHGMSLKKAT